MGKKSNHDLTKPQTSKINGDTTNGTKEKNSIQNEKVQNNGPPQLSFIHRHAFLITFLVDTMVNGLWYAVRGQFRYRFFHSKYQHQLDQYNFTRGGGCGSGKMDPEVKAIEDTISRETTQWSLYDEYASVVPLFIASLVIGMKSDQIGRRFLFLVPFVSGILNVSLLAAIIKFKLHYGWILIASFISACTGGNIGMYFASYAMVSDTHGKKKPSPEGDDAAVPTNESKEKEEKEKEKKPEEQEDDNDLDMSREKARTYKIVALDVLRRMVSSLISFATGYVIKYAGFFYTLIITLGVKVVLLIFAYVFVSETGQQKKNVGFAAPLRTISRALKDPKRRSTLILATLGLCCMVFGFVDEFQVIHTYQMSPPFCFDAVQLGWLESESRLRGIFAMPLMWLWKRLHFSEATIAAVGVFSNMIAALALGIFRYTWVFFANPIIQIPGTLASAMSKAITSRLIGRSALASTFAVMIAGEEVFWFVGSICGSYMYQHFVSTMPTAPFFLAAASFAVSTVLYTVLSLKHRWSSKAATTDAEMTVRN